MKNLFIYAVCLSCFSLSAVKVETYINNNYDEILSAFKEGVPNAEITQQLEKVLALKSPEIALSDVARSKVLVLEQVLAFWQDLEHQDLAKWYQAERRAQSIAPALKDDITRFFYRLRKLLIGNLRKEMKKALDADDVREAKKWLSRSQVYNQQNDPLLSEFCSDSMKKIEEATKRYHFSVAVDFLTVIKADCTVPFETIYGLLQQPLSDSQVEVLLTLDNEILSKPQRSQAASLHNVVAQMIEKFAGQKNLTALILMLNNVLQRKFTYLGLDEFSDKIVKTITAIAQEKMLNYRTTNNFLEAHKMLKKMNRLIPIFKPGKASISLLVDDMKNSNLWIYTQGMRSFLKEEKIKEALEMLDRIRQINIKLWNSEKSYLYDEAIHILDRLIDEKSYEKAKTIMDILSWPAMHSEKKKQFMEINERLRKFQITPK